jgi:plastocyanin
MKKILYLVMLTVLLLSTLFIVVACNGDGGNGGTTTTPTPTPTQPTQTTSQPPPVLEDNMVEIGIEGFNPLIITIKAGEKVTWVNRHDDRHWVTAEGKPAKPDTGVLAVGMNQAVTFQEPGEYPYFCLYHRDAEKFPLEQGMIVIVE